MGIVNLTHPIDLVAYGIDGRILEVLCGAEAAFTGRQVHALLGHGSAAGVQLGLNRLRRQGIVTAEPAGRAILYRLNASHLAAPYLRALVDLRRELLGRLRSEFEGWGPQPLGAYHGSELQYLFGRLPSTAQQALADRMHRAWVDFAATGDPGSASATRSPAVPLLCGV